MKKIVAFMGSQRRQGCGSQIVNAIKENAEKEGAEVELFYLGDLNIKPCQGCMYCRQGNGCSIKNDDMTKIYKAIEECHSAIFAIPIYFGQASGQILTLINRLYPLVPPKSQKKAVTIYTHGAPGKELYRPYINITDPIFKSLGFDVAKTIVAGGTGNLSDEAKAELKIEAEEACKELLA